ncbi:dioxygenase [Maribrevibacterium harenarium]|uniref:Dioxygenase n=1 Tax=Maribrevibacterium harenarium TaxID=2589817 RepID=A0A501WV71_9GAMM|nr:class III extradiol ring-cleavage dioxygenase [Maribrevibacterium harenarium]TPE49776.1 dioxygenase [Maribrevibacterium harenarium]
MATVAFVSHGGGPMPVLGDPGHADLVVSFADLAKDLPKAPSVIVVVSAHWETRGIEVTGAANPELIYDYYGFPAASYQLQYPAPGQPELAEGLVQQLAKQGLPVTLNGKRGFDHGMFIPLMLLYPEANIPVVQVSLERNLDPALHWQLGEALTKSLPEDALLLGSGFNFHNMRAFFTPKTDGMLAQVNQFQTWMDQLVENTDLSPQEKATAWQGWSQVEGGRYCHPREEHLLPLVVCHGAAQGGAKTYLSQVMGVPARHYLWG